ncbi:cytochrome d ubiquinol oxidase subunit II [Polymorphobacter megasporae]|uniref:cytochrome d ubiquinol oxidase subunit II n=1 Tax=Glacieibacterium megasporae TaxID=2835787 RepID=UPI001CAA6038|nr:cytochrome d ubiquinol oxidase subunit II [Polymorphobacter megasporae]UAJ12784.1 cytochrome d ubiquinol oxidase subunit II [Polymorphobacter megasporae]
MNIDLTIVWAGIIAFAVFAYVIMDGFDLGIGILFPWIARGEARNAAINSVAPVWDGNETWLVLGGGGLLAAFPLAYAVIMPAVYVPIIAMLLGLVFRGVAFEFRARTGRLWIWDAAFAFGSTVAALAQGITLGAILQGITVHGRGYGGGWWDWLTPFSLLTGIAVVIGYGLLGTCWLIYRTEGALQERCYRLAPWLGGATLAAVVAVSAATPFLSYNYYDRWLRAPGIYLTAPVPILVGVAALLFVRSLSRRAELVPFLLALGVFLLSFVGLGISMFPYLVPPSITIWDAAAPPASQIFMLVGVGIMVPVILAYTGYAYWVFRGKVGHEGYH